MTSQVTLPGRAFAAAWLNTFLATSSDDGRPVLYRTVLVEQFETGVQLIATDSYLLLGAYVPALGYELVSPPSLDERPLAASIVMDWDKRMHALMRHVYDTTKAAERDGNTTETFDVHLEIGGKSTTKTGKGGTPSLDPSLEPRSFIAQTTIFGTNERLSLQIMDAEYPNIRRFLTGRNRVATERIGMSLDICARLGKLRDAHSAVFGFDGEAGLIDLTAPWSELYLFGGIMPVDVRRPTASDGQEVLEEVDADGN